MGIWRQNKCSCGHKLCFINTKIVSTWETNPCSGAISPVSFPRIIATDLYYCRNKANEAKAPEVTSTPWKAQWSSVGSFHLEKLKESWTEGKQLLAIDANIHRYLNPISTTWFSISYKQFHHKIIANSSSEAHQSQWNGSLDLEGLPFN